jgi:hypothetical protein
MSFEVMSLQQDLSKSFADAPNHSAKKKSPNVDGLVCRKGRPTRVAKKTKPAISSTGEKTETGSTVTYSETDSVCTSSNKRVLQSYSSKKSPLSRPSMMHSKRLPIYTDIVFLESSTVQTYLVEYILFGFQLFIWPCVWTLAKPKTVKQRFVSLPSCPPC